MSENVVYRAKGEGETRLIGRGGDYVTAKAPGGETGERYTVYEVVSSPGFGPPLHRHEWQEFFYVLEGEVEFQYVDGGKTTAVIARPGDSFTVPARAPHGFRNPGSESNRFLVIDSPVGIEPFFLGCGVPVAAPGDEPSEEPLALERMGEVLPGYGVEILAVPSGS